MDTLLLKRFLAIVIDQVCALVLSLFPGLGGLLAAAYWLLRDGFSWSWMPQRSLGKQLLGLQITPAAGGLQAVSPMVTSLQRNWLLSLPALLSLNLFLPWTVSFLFGAGIWLLEGVKTLLDAEHRRFGDYMAKTQVRLVEPEPGA